MRCFEWLQIGLVTDEGNCYVKGYITNENNYGVTNIPPSYLRLDSFLKIYDKGDAKEINITNYGGTIVTQNCDVYVFRNNSIQYKSPTIFATGYKQACAWDDSHIFLLSADDDFGYASLDDPDTFHLIKKNVKKFVIEAKESEQGVAFVLTNDNKLYVLADDISVSNKYIDNIIDFDVLCPHTKLSIISLLDSNKNAYFAMGDYDLSYETLTDKTLFINSGNNIKKVSSYSYGIAMLDYKSRVLIYGTDYKQNSSIADKELQGDVVFNHASDVFGGNSNLIIVKENGEFMVFGYNSYDATYKSISN